MPRSRPWGSEVISNYWLSRFLDPSAEVKAMKLLRVSAEGLGFGV